MKATRIGLVLPAILAALIVQYTTATEEQCKIDCHSSPRPVGPTRPWDEMDKMRNPLHLTKPYPHHVAYLDDQEGKYAFAEFCDLGCNFFFVSSGASEAVIRPQQQRQQQQQQQQQQQVVNDSTLDRCITQCDEKFSYNITVAYNDLIEIARLECRDGCQMALKRCQPGYYCLQVSFNDDMDSSLLLNGGDMIPCPAGTYRETSYEATTECLECPPNYYREDLKGKSPLDCSKCPANTFSRRGSSSIHDCIRCPAGTFSVEAGFCQCITPAACEEKQLPPPADAEKRDTVPYIGLW
eukprot:scaffold1327_cov65-Cyclotella_meneghiniana.AAC.6